MCQDQSLKSRWMVGKECLGGVFVAVGVIKRQEPQRCNRSYIIESNIFLKCFLLYTHINRHT